VPRGQLDGPGGDGTWVGPGGMSTCVRPVNWSYTSTDGIHIPATAPGVGTKEASTSACRPNFGSTLDPGKSIYVDCPAVTFTWLGATSGLPLRSVMESIPVQRSGGEATTFSRGLQEAEAHWTELHRGQLARHGRD
jgi:hypothetical protein